LAASSPNDRSALATTRVRPDGWIAELHAAGYTIEGIFAEISIEESIRRTDAAHRHGEEELRMGRGCGGQYILPEAIRVLAHTSTPGETGPPDAAWYPGGGGVGHLIGDYQAGWLRPG
jgi:hypothetical protein